jgi:small subunit ribosomal protein S16
MLKIRLQRYGRTNNPSFRVVVVESSRGPKAGKHVDQIGFYNAVTKQKSINVEKAKYWMGKGAQPSDTVYNMLVTEGTISGRKINALPKKSPIQKEQPETTPETTSVKPETSAETQQEQKLEKEETSESKSE